MSLAILPKDGETQPDFAIRFHESTLSTIPNTAERNRQCFEAWARHTGEPEVSEARRYHKQEEFTERRNIPVFEEHELPPVKLSGGQFRKGVKYDRYALASICKNMNEQLADVGKCCPITNGHTSDNRNDPEPEVLGYTGAYRLGMIGNKKPRFAIFADEYHRRDRENILNGRRGRSVEVLPLPDVHKRTFYPIAALGADEPRLNLPPARYFRRPNDNVEVERYQMAMPGGNATFMPSDKYGDDPNDRSEQALSRKQIESLMQAFLASSMGQYILMKMQEDGQAGAPEALPHSPPEMADMPVDDPAMDGQPDPNQPPGAAPPAAPSPNMPAGPPQGAGPAPPKPPMAGGQSPKPFDKGTKPMVEDTDKYSKSFEALTARLDALEAENRSLKAKLTGSERYSKLANLKQKGYEFDLTEELGKVSAQSDEQFTQHCGTIEKYYRKAVTHVADFSAIAGVGEQADVPAEVSGVDQLTAADVEGVKRYSRIHGLSYADARERYTADKKSGTVKTA